MIGESGDDGEGPKRIFLSELHNDSLTSNNTVPWPMNIHNVEGCAVTAVDNRLVFVFAERAQGSLTTKITWTPLLLDPLGFGPVNSLEYRVPSEQQAGIRPVTAMEIDDVGNIFIASAIDPDNDVGPFASEIWLAGNISSGQDCTDSPISLIDSPVRLASMDGLKVEGLATRPAVNGSGTEIIFGTDDEFSGGVLRILPQK